MFEPGRATYDGPLCLGPRRDQRAEGHPEPRIPIIVGGNGPRVTAGLAIRYGDELNYVFLSPKEVAERMAAVRARCERKVAIPRRSVSRCTSATRRCATPAQARVDALGGATPRSVSTGSCASRLDGRRPPRPRRPSPRIAGRRGCRLRRRSARGLAAPGCEPGAGGCRPIRPSRRSGAYRNQARPTSSSTGPGRSGASRSDSPKPAVGRHGLRRRRRAARLRRRQARDSRRRTRRGRRGLPRHA